MQLAQFAHHAQTVQARHLDVHEDQVRLQLLNQINRSQAVSSRSHHLNIGEVFDEIRQLVLRQLLVIDDHRREYGRRALLHKLAIITDPPIGPAVEPIPQEIKAIE